MAERKPPRPKAPTHFEDYAAIRRRRDEIRRDEGKPTEEKPKEDPMHPLTGIFFADPIMGDITFGPCGVDFSEGEE